MKSIDEMNQPKDNIPTQFERGKIVTEKLSRELKELFGNSLFVINIATAIAGKHERALPLEQRADIVVQTKRDIDDVRQFLESETDFTIIREGPGLILASEDTSFYLKLTEQKEKPPMSLGKLQALLDILDSIKMGGTAYMRDIDALRKSLTQGSTVPLVTEGDNGLRVSYDRESDRLNVLFVRGFEKADNPRRKEVEDLIRRNFASAE